MSIDLEKDMDRFSGIARDFLNAGNKMMAEYFAWLAARCAFLLHPELREGGSR